MGEIAEALTATVEPSGTHLAVGLSGEPSLPAVHRVFDQVMGACEAHRLRAVLVDARGLTGELTILERFQLGVHFALHWTPGVRCAVVVSPESLHERRLLQKVAESRGVEIRLFGASPEAFAWLGGAA